MERGGFCASFGPILSGFGVFAVCKIWQMVYLMCCKECGCYRRGVMVLMMDYKIMFPCMHSNWRLHLRYL